MKAKGYHFGAHYLPHDGESRNASGKNIREMLTEAGLANVRVLPRCHSEWPGVNKAAEILPRCVFNSTTTSRLLESLAYYHTRKDTRDGFQTDTLVDDWSAHDSDTFRMLAEAILNGKVTAHAQVIRETRPQSQRQKIASTGSFRKRS